MRPSHLDAHDVPPPPHDLLARLHAGRRRRIALVGGACVAIVALGAVLAMDRVDDDGSQLAITTSVSTTAPPSSTVPPTTVDPSSLELASTWVPDGFVPGESGRVSGGTIETLGFVHPDGRGIEIERLRAHQAAALVTAEEVPGSYGRAYLLGDTVEGHRLAMWFTDTGDVVTLHAYDLTDDERIAVLDGVELVPVQEDARG